MAKKGEEDPKAPFFCHFGAILRHFQPQANFLFSGHSFPFSAFGPLSILCQATRLANLHPGMGVLKGENLEDRNLPK